MLLLIYVDYMNTYFVQVGSVPGQWGRNHADNFAKHFRITFFGVHVVDFRFKNSSFQCFSESLYPIQKKTILKFNNLRYLQINQYLMAEIRKLDALITWSL